MTDARLTQFTSIPRYTAQCATSLFFPLHTNGYGRMTWSARIQGNTLEERRENLIGGLAHHHRIQADTGKDVPGTHGSIVLVHLRTIASRLAGKCLAYKRLWISIITSITMGNGLGGQAAHHRSCFLGSSQSAKQEGNMYVWFVSLVV